VAEVAGLAEAAGMVSAAVLRNAAENLPAAPAFQALGGAGGGRLRGGHRPGDGPGVPGGRAGQSRPAAWGGRPRRGGRAGPGPGRAVSWGESGHVDGLHGSAPRVGLHLAGLEVEEPQLALLAHAELLRLLLDDLRGLRLGHLFL
jgi:hypothetical protein